MDLKTFVNGPTADADHVAAMQAAAADQMSSTAKHALDGCIFGLSPTSAQTHVQIGEAYIDGNRLRLRANEAIDIGALTRPTGTMVAWVTVLASYATEATDTITDEDGVQYTLCTDDSISISLSRGVNAASKSAAVKPAIPSGSIVLCDILLDATTAVGSLDGDPSRRPQCPDDELRTDSDLQWDAIRALQATQAASLQSPNKGPTPTATSTVALRIDATWAAGTVDTGVPAITKAKFRWRQAGENWADNRTTSLLNVQEYEFSVPDADSDVQMQTQYGNGNGFGEWSDTGTIDAADIEAPPALQTHQFDADEVWLWLYPQSTSAQLTIVGGDGAGGGSGGGGGAGGSNPPPPTNRSAGQDGVDGSDGTQGDTSRVQVAARSFDESADGGLGGSGGPGGLGGPQRSTSPDSPDADDASDRVGGGVGGSPGGQGGIGPLSGDNNGGDGGDGGDGASGTPFVVSIAGLAVGDSFTITIGAAGAAGAAGSGGVDRVALPGGGDGVAGLIGDAGSVKIEPLI